MKIYTLAFIVLIFLLGAMYYKGCDKREDYADQVVHGTVGGIAGPIMDPSLFVPPVPKNVPMLFKQRRAKYPETASI